MRERDRPGKEELVESRVGEFENSEKILLQFMTRERHYRCLVKNLELLQL